MADDTCVWADCINPRHPEMPICFVHAYLVHRTVDDILSEDQPGPARTVRRTEGTERVMNYVPGMGGQGAARYPRHRRT